MNIKLNYFLLIVLSFTIALVLIMNSKQSVSETLLLEEIKTSELEKNIQLLNNENSALRIKLAESLVTKPTNTQVNITKALKPELDVTALNETELLKDKTIKESEAPVSDISNLNNESLPINEHFNAKPEVSNVGAYVDIDKPFNGIDPASNEQKKIYSEFKYEIDGYNFNERFDMKGFLSDARFGELHASLGSKLLNYVDEKLVGIKLIQDSNPAALTELNER